MKLESLRTGISIALCLVVPACLGESPVDVEVAPGVDEAAFARITQNYRRSGELTEITGATYPSAVGGTSIRVWVSTFAATEYRAIDPEKTGSQVHLAPGSLIVREVYAAGSLEKLTLMGKGPVGYNPTVGDYWFAVTDPDGTPQVELGVPLTGKLQQCFGCHQTRNAGDDFLFGVPARHHSAGGAPAPAPPMDPGPDDHDDGDDDDDDDDDDDGR
jgi:hypothetical protein